MAMVKCPECGSEMSDTSEVCPKCGYRNKRSVGFGLGFGIWLMPWLFAWFTLRKGYSGLARTVSFAWLIFVLTTTIMFFGSMADAINEANSTPMNTIDSGY